MVTDSAWDQRGALRRYPAEALTFGEADYGWGLLTRTLPSPLTSPGSLQRVPCGGSSAESVEGRLEKLQTAIVSKPGLWLQPEVAPVST